MIDSKSRLLVVVVAVEATAACLPRGNPPAGRQLIADRAAAMGAIVPPNGDGMLRILFMRPSTQDPTGSDLFVVSLSASGQQSPERLLISNIEADIDLGCTWKVAPCSFDSKGRAFVYRNLTNDTSQPGPSAFNPLWVDPVTGDIEDANTATSTSPSGQRSFVTADFSNTTATLVEADGFYFLDSKRDLIDIPPSEVPQQVTTGVAAFFGWPTPDGARLILTRTTADTTVEQLSILDRAAGQETPLPFDGRGTIGVSPDGQWLLYSEFSRPDRRQFTLFDYHTGTTQPLDFGPSYVNAQWRPGHNELWVGVPDDKDVTPIFWVVTPGGSTITVQGVYFSGFTLDGAYWFSTTDTNMSAPALQIGLADDPTGPRVPYNPPGTTVQSQTVLPDGRVLESVYAQDQQRADVIAVDPRTGDTRLLAERGRIAALGQTRFIGMFHFEGGRGDLTAVELASGHSTVLAPEFTITAFAEPQGDDLVAAGTRIVYQFQARTASPYDGIWLANCP
ncbi:MAG: hypothetical protein ACJ8F1_08565 [Polyangia bacterium]